LRASLCVSKERAKQALERLSWALGHV
jgi:hypothetical protein